MLGFFSGEVLSDSVENVIRWFMLQGGKLPLKSSEQQVLPSDKHFQTDALRVALLSQV
jgi:hypothetical protein